MKISPSAEQCAAIKAIVKWYGTKHQEFYLAGYAGVGKSTIANIAIDELKDKYGITKVRTAAYTGKAASVLRRKGVEKAQTIHSLIYSPTVDEKTGALSFSLSEESDAAKAELIVLDECSMVGEDMAKDLRSFGKKILIMGDPGQLPPVRGQGAFTNRQPDVFLREIHRQNLDSPILHLATLARQGERLPSHYEIGRVKVLPLTKETQSLVYREDTQLICGLNRVRWTYTQRIRTLRGHEGRRPNVGERLICCKNNRREGLFNGAMGTLNDLKSDYKGAHGAWEVDVKLDDVHDPKTSITIDPFHFDNHFMFGEAKRLEVPGMRFDEFDWGYAITCHKAQGSSWDHVTIIDDSGSFREHRNHWLYTALTRAENGLTLLTRQ
ncbi:ATP-dependent DNA helicase [Acidicapsa acidisoli]|uniref:ATP-dependent DNA helicase n=1 Tax=Acidicapsa acidisoli TaxID=1615681 RepID=UPI0021E062D0|nr:ATP-dependent RecD-like DNA helicase [Acidicapsa acidisoli]